MFVARNTANKRQIIIGYLDQRIRHEFVSSLLQFTIRLLRVKNYEEFLWRAFPSVCEVLLVVVPE